MKKIELIDLIKSHISSVDKTNRYHSNVINYSISTVYNELIVKTYTKELYDLGLFTKKYGLSTAITVSKDTITEEYYSILPEEIVPLPDLNAGVREILAKLSRSLVFVPMRNDEYKLIEGLEVQQIDDVIGYTLYAGQSGEKGRVVYTGMTAPIASAGVIMSLVIPFHAYDDDDVVYIPKGQEDLVIRSVLEKLGIIPPVDLTNNNSDITNQRR